MTQRRLVHRSEPHLAAIETTFLPEGWSGTVEVRSTIDGAVENNGVERYRALGRRHLRVERTWAPAEDIVALVAETTDSRIRIAEAARTRVLGASDGSSAPSRRRGHIGHRLVVPVTDGQEIVVEKVVTIYTSRDQGIYEPGDHAVRHVAWASGYDDLAVSNTRAWAHVWRRTDIEIEGSESLARGLMLQLYQLHQVISKHTTTLDVGIPARGLVGEAYRGHIFWDELFVFPYVNLRVPEHARALLMYRFRRLDEARRRARRPASRAPSSRGRAHRVAARRLPRPISTPARGTGCPTTPGSRGTSTPPSPTTSCATSTISVIQSTTGCYNAIKSVFFYQLAHYYSGTCSNNCTHEGEKL